MEDRANSIEVRNLTSFYGARRILSGISFAIPRNKVTVIMGVSGSGKTTLFRHLVGLKATPPEQILVEGEDLGLWDAARLQVYRRRIGVLFQSGALFSSMTVAENLAVALKVHTRLADETIGIMTLIKLHMVGLSMYGSYMPSQLSGGMRKRAGLARALILDPEILFVDEPSSGLDPITAAGLDQLLLDLREALGMTIIVVTHELESAFQIADRMIVMDQGELLASGTPQEVRVSTDPRVIQFLKRQAGQRCADAESYLHLLMKEQGRR